MKFRLPTVAPMWRWSRCSSVIAHHSAGGGLSDNSACTIEAIVEHSYATVRWGWVCYLGALLMSLGLPYDSDEGRLCRSADRNYARRGVSAVSRYCAIARSVPGLCSNREPMLEVMRSMHADAPQPDSRRIWCPLGYCSARHLGRNTQTRREARLPECGQVTVLAPTGCLVGNP